MWAGLSPFGGPTKIGLSDMIVRQSGRDSFAHEPGCDHAEPRTRFDVLVKTGEAFNGDARRSDPYGDRARSHGICRLRHLLNKTDGRKAAQEKKREVTQTDEEAYVADSSVGEDVVSEPTGDGVWRQS